MSVARLNVWYEFPTKVAHCQESVQKIQNKIYSFLYLQVSVILSTIGLMTTGLLLILVTARPVRIQLDVKSILALWLLNMSNIDNFNIYLFIECLISNVCPFPVENVSLGKRREEELSICDRWPRFIEFRLLNVVLRNQLFKYPSVKLHNCLTVSLIWWDCQQLSQTKYMETPVIIVNLLVITT